MGYTVKNLKSFQVREGYGFECSLYKDGKRIGTVTDTAHGGMIDFYLDKGEEKILDDYCDALPKEQWGNDDCIPKAQFDKFYPKGRAIDKDLFVANLVDKFEKNKQFKRWCKKQTVYRIDGDKKGSYRTMPILYDSRVKASLENKYKDKGLVIINETIKA